LVFGFGLSVFAQNEITPCPEIDVSGGEVNPEILMSMSFSVNVGDEAKNLKLEYKWTVSHGKMIEGQGTPSIKIDTNGLNDVNITATVEIKGLPENCANTDSETGSAVICYRVRLFDEYGRLSTGEFKARLENLYVELGNNPNFQGYVIIYGTDKEIADRERQIAKAISFLKLDASRVTVVSGGANPNAAGIWTKVWVVPPGVDSPQPD
jgi:hypothetical protein